MMKKFKQDKSIWMNTCLFYVRNSKLDTARSVFQKSLTAVDKKDRKFFFFHIQIFTDLNVGSFHASFLIENCRTVERGRSPFSYTAVVRSLKCSPFFFELPPPTAAANLLLIL